MRRPRDGQGSRDIIPFFVTDWSRVFKLIRVTQHHGSKRIQAEVIVNAAEFLQDPAVALRGKVVWITGASSGIGEYLAYELVKYGCKLVLSARRKAELERVKKNCTGTVKKTLCKMGLRFITSYLPSYYVRNGKQLTDALVIRSVPIPPYPALIARHLLGVGHLKFYHYPGVGICQLPGRPGSI